MALPRGGLTGTVAVLLLGWGSYALDRTAWPGIVLPLAQTVICVGLLALTAASQRAKVAVVRTVQRWTINPLMAPLLRLGVNPLGLVMLETRGRSSGQLRRTPVGNGRIRDTLWIIAEHGTRAHYVRNIQADPRVRIRLRVGLRYRWVAGVATVLPDEDALARQRHLLHWHPLRLLNAMTVRLLGTDLLTVHVRLLLQDGSLPSRLNGLDCRQSGEERASIPPAHCRPCNGAGARAGTSRTWCD